MPSIYTTDIFDTWYQSVSDKQLARRIQARIDRAERGLEIVVLLVGGNKSTQSKDIKTALQLAEQLSRSH